MVLNNPERISQQTAPVNCSDTHAIGTAILAKKVIAVVVSFNPDQENFAHVLDTLLPQVAGAIVVDNASSPNIRPLLAAGVDHNIELLQLAQNIGIAAAQNAGIERALDLGADFVLLLDQDSVPSKSMVAELLTVIMSVSGPPEARPVAAVGPARIDRRTGQRSFFMVNQAGLLRQWQPDTQDLKFPPFIETEFLLASGTLIPIEVFKSIGSMRSNYFIDHVDREWCFRAKAAGYRLLGVPASILEHQIGDSVKLVYFFSPVRVSWHPPLRNYYLFRNAVLMHRDIVMSLPWKFYFLWRLLRYAAGVLILAKDKRQRLHFMMLGLLHGLKGISGQLENASNRCSSLPSSPLEPRPKSPPKGSPGLDI